MTAKEGKSIKLGESLSLYTNQEFINKEGKIIIEPSYELNTNEPIFIGEYYQVIYGNGEIYYTK